MNHPHDDAQPNTNQTHLRDPGTPLSSTLALIAAIVFAGGIILWQNTPESTQYHLLGAQVPESPIDAESPAPGRFAQFDIIARMFIRGHKLLNEQPTDYSAIVMEQFAVAYTNEDQIRAIIMSGEYEGSEPALDRVHTMQSQLRSEMSIETPETIEFENETFELESRDDARRDLVLAELDALQSIYTDGPDSIDQPMRDQLIARYGVLGQAVLTHGMDDSDPARQPLVTGFLPIILLLFGLLAVVGFGFLAGLVLLVLGIINLSSDRLTLRFQPPEPGGSVFLETYALFVGAFALLSIGLFVLSVKVSPELGALSIPLQWILMVVPAWALIRGMKSKAWRHAIGLHSGEGLFKEIGAGFLVYIASIPVYAVGVVITIIVMLVQGAIASNKGTPPEVPTNPIFDLISQGSPLLILLVFALATIWAPITEELIFRGALFRHLSGRLHWVFAALFSALLFAYMHSYGPLMVAPLIALGFMFAFMRQWRGSIIPSMTAHFIHNATLMLFMITLITLLKDPVVP